ncbi:hypothetical protein PG995_007710 [Apiospora arundinis]
MAKSWIPKSVSKPGSPLVVELIISGRLSTPGSARNPVVRPMFDIARPEFLRGYLPSIVEYACTSAATKTSHTTGFDMMCLPKEDFDIETDASGADVCFKLQAALLAGRQMRFQPSNGGNADDEAQLHCPASLPFPNIDANQTEHLGKKLPVTAVNATVESACVTAVDKS